MSRVAEKLRIVGVDCPTCVYAIHKALTSINGVERFEVDVTSGNAMVVYDDSITTLSNLVDAIRKVGYDVEYMELLLELDEDVHRVESLIFRRCRGVIEIRLMHFSKLVKIIYNPYSTSKEALINCLRSMEIEPKEVSNPPATTREDIRRELLIRLTSFTLGFIAILYHSLDVLVGLTIVSNLRNYSLLAIASIVMILCRDIITRGFKSLIRGVPVMDTLIALSATITYVFSLAVVVSGIELNNYFEASAGVLGFVSLGKYLESRLRSKAIAHLKELNGLQVGKVRVVRGNSVSEVELTEVRVGDVIEVKAGEKIPVDGVVIDGWGYVDESTFTGEPIPNLKESRNRDPVLAGSLLTSGYLRVRATRVGKGTLLARIIESVGEAQLRKPRIQRVADRVVGYLTWFVILLAIATFAYWTFVEGRVDLATIFTASLFAVACPCPLGIAIPIAVSLAIIKASRLGILIRSSDVFEKLSKVNVVLFDKTGTLTKGSPRVEKVITLNGFNEDEVLELVCSVERRSEHVLAKAILNYCSERGVEGGLTEEFEHIPGMGVLGRVNGKDVVVGSTKLFEGLEIKLNNDTLYLLNELNSKGCTTVLIAVNGAPSAIICVKDGIRDDVYDLIVFLRSKDMRLCMATGDSELVSKAIANEVDLDEVYALLTPIDKAELVEKMQKDGLRVMFVGDGVNDALALSKAFVGIAMGSGADISKEAGDAVIVNNKLSSLINLYRLGDVTRRKYIENIVWVFIYNALLIPISIGLLYKSLGIILRPEIAAIAMILSDISVVLNSLTLLRWR